MRHLRKVSELGAQTLPLVLLAGFAEDEAEVLRLSLEDVCEAETASDLQQALAALDRRGVAVLCLGPLLSGAASQKLAGQAFGGAVSVLLTAAGPDPAPFQDLIDGDQLFYLSLGPLPVPELTSLIRGALERRRQSAARPESPAEPSPSGALPARMRWALQAARQVVAQPDLTRTGELLRSCVEEIVEADRAYCLLYDPASETLWSRATGLAGEERQESAAVGPVSFVARTALPVRVERLSADPRYEREADDPLGARGEQLLAVPICEPQGRVLAVLSAVRDAGRPGFSAADLAEFELLAATVAPSLAQLELESRLDREARQKDRDLRGRTSNLFRGEAVEHHLAAGSGEGDWLRLSPRWMGATFWLAVLVAALLVYSLVGTIDEYASGPAVVRLSGRTEVTAGQPGAVAAVEVRTGDRVAAGQPLVRFRSAQESAELERIERELELQLIERLRDLSDPLRRAP